MKRYLIAVLMLFLSTFYVGHKMVYAGNTGPGGGSPYQQTLLVLDCVVHGIGGEAELGQPFNYLQFHRHRQQENQCSKHQISADLGGGILSSPLFSTKDDRRGKSMLRSGNERIFLYCNLRI